MASVYRDSARNGWRAQIYVRGVRRKLWLGAVTKSAARSIAVHLEALNLARDTGTVAPAATRLWLASISDRIRNNLAAWGLVDQQAASRQLPRTLGPYLRQLIDGRDDWSASAKTRFNNVRLRLCNQLGTDTALSSITPGDAAKFARWARTNLNAHSHSGKTISDARQLFRCAIQDRILVDNPFDGIDSSQQHDSDREAYITADVAQRLIALADPHLAALIALARFAGLRVPSEPMKLQWDQIDWSAGRCVITATKTKRHKPKREIPLFPEIVPHLQALDELAADGDIHVFTRYRSTAAKVYRSHFTRLLKRAGIEPWPKLWMNLRASARTDLLEIFPAHVVNAWLGHSGKIGAKHYDRVTDAHFAAASVSVGSPVGSQPRIHPHSPALAD